MALILGGVAITAIITLSSFFVLGSLLFLFGNSSRLLLGMLLEVSVHAFYVLQSESCCQDGDFYLAPQLRVDGKSPFQLEVVAERLHEVVDIVHLVHGETWIVLLLASESDAQEDLLGVENIIVVEKR